MLYQLSYWPTYCVTCSRDGVPTVWHRVTQANLFGFAMQRMLLTTRTVFIKFHPVRIVASILLRYVIAFFAIVACQDNNRADIFLFRSHDLLSNFLYIIE